MNQKDLKFLHRFLTKYPRRESAPQLLDEVLHEDASQLDRYIAAHPQKDGAHRMLVRRAWIQLALYERSTGITPVKVRLEGEEDEDDELDDE